MKSIRIVSFFTPLALLLFAGCSEAPREPLDAPEQDASAARVDAQPRTGANGMITSAPGEVACQPPSVVTISWDATSANTGGSSVESVQIWVGDEGSESKLFGEGGIKGSHDTGPWVSPEQVFRLMSASSGQELDRIVVGGSCADSPGEVGHDGKNKSDPAE